MRVLKVVAASTVSVYRLTDMAQMGHASYTVEGGREKESCRPDPSTPEITQAEPHPLLLRFFAFVCACGTGAGRHSATQSNAM